MSSWTWAGAGLLIGWLIVLSAQKKDHWGVRVWAKPQGPMLWPATIGAMGAIFFGVLALAHDLRHVFPLIEGSLPAAIEEGLVKSQSVWLLLWAAGGALLAWRRKEVFDRLDQLYHAFLGRSQTSPWALQSALAILALFGIVLMFRPVLLDKIQSIRAGEVEAKFETASTRIKDTLTKVDVNLFHVREIITIWANFNYMKDVYRPNWIIAKDWNDLPDEPLDVRMRIYKANEYNFMKMKIAEKLFSGYIHPLIKSLATLKKIDESEFERLRYDSSLHHLVAAATLAVNEREFDAQKATVVMEAIRAVQVMIDERLDRLCRDPRKCSTCTECGKEQNAASAVAGAMGKALPHRLTPEEDASLLELFDGKAFDIHAKEAEKKCDKSANKPTNKKQCQEDEAERYDRWDAYAVAAIGDLVAFAGNQTDKAHFLFRIKERFPLLSGCAYDDAKAGVPTPGNMNFHGQLADAMLHSGDKAYSVAEIQDELELADVNYDCILNSEKLRDSAKNNWPDIERTYRRNKVTSLPEYLELYGIEAIFGRKLNQTQLAKWREAYAKARKIVLFLNGRKADMSDEGDNAEIKWLDAKPTIEKEPYLLQEIAVWAALSAVAIPQHSGEKIGTTECAEAKTLLEISTAPKRRKDIKESEDKTENDIARIENFIEQVRIGIEDVCGS